MSKPMDVFLGFDPGGTGDGGERGNFGWSICTVDDMQFRRVCSGRGDIALNVANRVVEELQHNPKFQNAHVKAAGIDAPLFWHSMGEDREVDKLIRRQLPPARNGQQQIVTKSSVISIRGRNMWAGLLIQGPLIADLLYRKFSLPITESHPKVLNYLDNRIRNRIHRLPINEHERDATFAAYAAWHIGDPNWQNLFLIENDPKVPMGTPVSYWMPIPMPNPV